MNRGLRNAERKKPRLPSSSGFLGFFFLHFDFRDDILFILIKLIAAEELLGNFGKILIGLGVSCAVMSGIMGFYLASSRLMYSMSREGYLPKWFRIVDE